MSVPEHQVETENRFLTVSAYQKRLEASSSVCRNVGASGGGISEMVGKCVHESVGQKLSEIPPRQCLACGVARVPTCGLE